MSNNPLRRSILLPLLLTAAALSTVFTWVDLSPRVEPDFFFSPEDPQHIASAEIAERFPGTPQVIVKAAASDIRSEEYRERVTRLAQRLGELDGVMGVTSIANHEAFESPLWSRILIAPNEDATNLLLDLSDAETGHQKLVDNLEGVVEELGGPDFTLVISGVPYVIEQIRRSLFRDLAVFSSVAVFVFAIIVAIIYRAWPVVVGTLAACLTASSLTLVLTQLLGGAVGLLTANVATIVFVLTLSHVVFLTSNWKLCCTRKSADPVTDAVRMTVPASSWCMLTTLLGFSSLLLATAKPLRELAFAGAIGTLTAFGIAYLITPGFLRLASTSERGQSRVANKLRLRNSHGTASPVVFLLVASAAAFGIPRLNTDPGLLSYFNPNTPLRQGLEAVDSDGGSSPLSIVVTDGGGGRIDTRDAIERGWDLQQQLEADPAVGSVVSLSLIIAEARRAPLVGLLPPSVLLDLASRTSLSTTVAGFVRPERDQGLYFLRMREGDRSASRQSVIDRIENMVRAHQFEPVLVGGLYEQQGQLASLLASSLKLGLGTLVALFLVISYVVSREYRVTMAMVICLAGIPMIVLGTLGYAGIALDIISSPAANVALAMGVDSMIHLAMRARRYRRDGSTSWEAWSTAQQELWHPVVGAALIISVGFGIFSLSTFPPTQTFGLAVILGTVTAAVITLYVLPYGAAGMRRR